MATIKAPVEGYNGQIGDVVFTDSVAETDNMGVIMYCRGAGYEVDGTVDNPAARPLPAVDSSKTHQLLGTRLRDAAVDPQPVDFLPPINAGQADPHGPQVVSPGLHATAPRPVVHGPVADEVATQQHLEAATALQALVDPQPVPTATAELAEANTTDGPQAALEVPAGNASHETWAAWVIATHPELDPDSVRKLKRDDLREQYGPKED